MPMQRVLSVTRPAFDDAFGLLVANFGTQNDAVTLKAVKQLYLKVFQVWEIPAQCDDHILREAVEGLITRRTERGMPRLAEIIEAVHAIRERDVLFRTGQRMRDALRELQYALQEDKASRRATLEQCVEAVASTLGQIQRQQADERAERQRRVDAHEIAP